jgi:hypothetical protein
VTGSYIRHDAVGVRCVHGVGDLKHDGGDFVGGKRRVALRVPLENFARRPFDREVVQTIRRHPGFDGAHHVLVLNAGAKGGLALETGDGGLVLAQFFTQDFHGHFAVFGMLRAIYRGRSAFTNAVEQVISGQRAAYEGVTRHAAKLTFGNSASKRNDVFFCG